MCVSLLLHAILSKIVSLGYGLRASPMLCLFIFSFNFLNFCILALNGTVSMKQFMVVILDPLI